MDKKEYAKYLAEIIGEDIDIDSDDINDQFYGYFQSFMPNGNGVEKVFKPIPNGDLYYDRIIKIYSAAEERFNELSEEGAIPGYFCPNPVKDKELLIKYGKQYIENLKLFAQTIDDKEFEDALMEVKTIEVLEDNSDRNNENETNDIIYETISDWFIDNSDYESIIEILDEAYYSINCDYFLSYYLQYPSYEDKLKFDLFAPYFEIWKMGYYCWFDKGKLIIG